MLAARSMQDKNVFVLFSLLFVCSMLQIFHVRFVDILELHINDGMFGVHIFLAMPNKAPIWTIYCSVLLEFVRTIHRGKYE